VLEELVAVEENIVGIPGARSCQQSTTKVLDSEAQRFGVVPCDLGFRLCHCKLLASRRHPKVAVVHEPQCTNGRDDERNPVGPLNGELGVR
jgi:hypothetical protein